MTTIPVKPLVLKDYTFQVAADNYEKALSAVLFNPPSTSTITWEGPIGEDHADIRESGGWTCQTDYAQDWETPDSFAGYLFDHAGEEVEVVFVPRAGTGLPSFTATLVLAPGPIGGTTRQFAAGSVTHACKAKPVRGVTA